MDDKRTAILSKRKQNICDKYLKKRNKQTNQEYKQYESLFEATRKKPKKIYYSKLIEIYKNNGKKRDIMKKVIAKTKTEPRNMSWRIAVGEK